MPLHFTLGAVVAKMKQLGYKVFDKRDYDLTLVGLRATPGKVNAFDDMLLSIYNVGGIPQIKAWPITTDPGKYYLQNPMRVEGTAILCPQQARSCWRLGLHKGYPALTQSRPEVFLNWRDRDKDTELDYAGKQYRDILGANCHHAGFDSILVDKWSAGCQVFKRIEDYEVHMMLVRKQISEGIGDTFSYALIEWPS